VRRAEVNRDEQVMDGTLNGYANSDLDSAANSIEDDWAELRGASIFLTGATGFFGSWLLALLAHAERGHKLGLKVCVLTRDADAFRARWPELAALPFLTAVEGDVRYFEFPKPRFTHIIHAATDTSVAADQSPLQLMDTIVRGTQRTLEFAVSTRARRFLYVSSGAVYGAQPADLEAMPETYMGACDPLDRRSVYGQAKRLAEQLCTVFRTERGLETVVARAFAIVGPGMPIDAHLAIGNFIRDATAGQTIRISGDGTPLRSYLYASDLAAWLVRMLLRGRSGAAYNVGSDQAVSIGDLARLVASTLSSGSDVSIAQEPQGGNFRSRYIPNVDKARRDLSLDVWTPLDQAIARTAEWARGPAAARHKSSPRRNENAMTNAQLTFVIDVDGVVASLTSGNDYKLCEPLTSNIEAVNRLYDAGHRIVMMTARGSATGIDWSEQTRAQFERWGLKYHDLHFGKPAADYYVDDRMLSIADLQAFIPQKS
jgi:nucleoside-diphosphate-sugar epimerase